MYNNDSKPSWLSDAVVAGAGAGVITTFAVARGQNPLIALVITGFATVMAIAINRHFA